MDHAFSALWSGRVSPEDVANSQAKTYRGRRDATGVVVEILINDVPYGELANTGYHSLTGFEWGYGGSGPANLAYSLIFDACDQDKVCAEKWYQIFKYEVVAQFPREGWSLPAEAVRAWVDQHEAQWGI